MWTEITGSQYERCDLRDASDLKHEAWYLLMLLLAPMKRSGRARTANLRAVLNAIL